MAQALERAGVRHPRSGSFSDLATATRWLETTSLQRCVVKPRSSSASDGVRLIEDLPQLSMAFHAIMSSPTILGNKNAEVLVSEWLESPEVYVNTVTHDGHVSYEEAWLSAKSVTHDGIPQYDYQEPLSSSDPLAVSVGAYLRLALNALGVRWGAAHSEVRHSAAGPVLIDMGARLGGGSVPGVEYGVCGDTQAHAYARMLLNGEPPERRSEMGIMRVRRVWLNNQHHGVIGDRSAFEVLRALATAVYVSAHVRDGIPLNRTTNLVDSPGYVLLASPERTAVESDHATIRELESAAPFYGKLP